MTHCGYSLKVKALLYVLKVKLVSLLVLRPAQSSIFFMSCCYEVIHFGLLCDANTNHMAFSNSGSSAGLHLWYIVIF